MITDELLRTLANPEHTGSAIINNLAAEALTLRAGVKKLRVLRGKLVCSQLITDYGAAQLDAAIDALLPAPPQEGA